MTLARPRHLGALVLASMLLVLLRPAPAFACSCVMFEPDTFAEQHQAAFVGTLVDQVGESWTFEVETVVAGELPETLTVHSQVGDGANCGLMMDVGQRSGVGLFGGEAGWETNSCQVIDAELLLAATDGHPPLPVTGDGATTTADPSDDGGARTLGLVALALGGSAVVLGGAVWVARRSGG